MAECSAPAWNVVGLARLVGRRLAVYGQVERPVTTMPHWAPWAWGGTSNLSAALKKTAWPSGPEIIRPSKPVEGRVYLREVLDPTRIRVQSGSFPCERRVCAAGPGVIILTVPRYPGVRWNA